MKTNKITSLVSCLVAAMFFTSVVGCKKGPDRVTPIPGIAGKGLNDQPAGPRELPNGGNLDGAGPRSTPITGPDGVIPTSTTDRSNWQVAADQPFRGDTVLFDFDKSVVKASEIGKVTRVAEAFRSLQGKALRIEGHCDERGTEEYNRSLGERRALAIREKLASMGVDANMVDTISFGEDRPADPGHNEQAFAKNRRGEFIVLEPPAGATARNTQ